VQAAADVLVLVALVRCLRRSSGWVYACQSSELSGCCCHTCV
jgi:hypothetical protein